MLFLCVRYYYKNLRTGSGSIIRVLEMGFAAQKEGNFYTFTGKKEFVDSCHHFDLPLLFNMSKQFLAPGG